MKIKSYSKCMMLAGILAFSPVVIANDDVPEEEQVIILTNNNGGTDEQTLQVPVTATVNKSVLNVQFTGTVPMATVSVNNSLTGTTVSQKSMTALSGSFCTVPVAGLSQGTYTVSVTNNVSGESVSGDFEVEGEE